MSENTGVGTPASKRRLTQGFLGQARKRLAIRAISGTCAIRERQGRRLKLPPQLYGCLLVLSVFLFMLAHPVLAKPPGKGAYPSFQQQFLYGMVVFETGAAKWVTGGPAGSAVAQGTLLPKSSVIETGDAQIGEVRMGNGSRVRLGPSTRLKILPFSLELEKGSVLARHMNSPFPMKIQGASTLLINEDSLVDVQRQKDTFYARVQVGEARTPGLKDIIKAGQSFEATGKTAALSARGPQPQIWENPRLNGGKFARPSNREELFPDDLQESEAIALESPAEPTSVAETPTPAPPTPSAPSTPSDPTPEPTKGGAPIEGEDWMKNPVPADDDQ